MRTYKISSLSKSGGRDPNYCLRVPSEVGKALDRDVLRFAFELTDDGILYRAVRPEEDPTPPQLPLWATGEQTLISEPPVAAGSVL